MRSNIFREYRLKFYLNINHYVIFNNHKGEIHPHTWEFTLEILVDREKIMIFNDVETAVNEFFSTYQNKTINTVVPFDTINPTIENVTDYFAGELYNIINQFGTTLIKISSSETPSRTYIYDFMDKYEYAKDIEEKESKTIDNVIEQIIKRGLKK